MLKSLNIYNNQIYQKRRGKKNYNKNSFCIQFFELIYGQLFRKILKVMGEQIIN